MTVNGDGQLDGELHHTHRCGSIRVRAADREECSYDNIYYNVELKRSETLRGREQQPGMRETDAPVLLSSPLVQGVVGGGLAN